MAKRLVVVQSKQSLPFVFSRLEMSNHLTKRAIDSCLPRILVTCIMTGKTEKPGSSTAAGATMKLRQLALLLVATANDLSATSTIDYSAFFASEVSRAWNSRENTKDAFAVNAHLSTDDAWFVGGPIATTSIIIIFDLVQSHTTSLRANDVNKTGANSTSLFGRFRFPRYFCLFQLEILEVPFRLEMIRQLVALLLITTRDTREPRGVSVGATVAAKCNGLALKVIARIIIIPYPSGAGPCHNTTLEACGEINRRRDTWYASS